MANLSIDVSDIIDQAGAEKDFTGQLSVETVRLADRQVLFGSPVMVSGKLSNIGHGILAVGEFTVVATLECSRCLGDHDLEIAGFFEELFLLSQPIDSEDSQLVVAGKIDLDNPIYEQVMTEVPFISLCREECAGICQVCGRNKNIHPHVCQEEPFDIRMATLKNYLEKKEEN